MTKLQKPAQKELKEVIKAQDQLGMERLLFFSDAVFAIAITILILDIRLPAGAETAGSRELLRMLASLWPEYLAYFISFWVIGLSWISHHRKFHYIQRIDNSLLTLNLLMLMLIAFIPFPTAVLSKNTSFTASAFYAVTMILVSLSGILLWWHAVRNHRLVDSKLDSSHIRMEVTLPLATIAIFVLSIGIAAIDAGLARLCWLLIFPLVFFLRRRAA
jgi:uncharacterized membrane protein